MNISIRSFVPDTFNDRIIVLKKYENNITQRSRNVAVHTMVGVIMNGRSTIKYFFLMQHLRSVVLNATILAQITVILNALLPFTLNDVIKMT